MTESTAAPEREEERQPAAPAPEQETVTFARQYRRPESLVGRLMWTLERTGVQIFLAVVALFWLLPTFGLLITSLRPVQAFAESGWWSVLLAPAQLTLQNYGELLAEPLMVRSIWNTFYITIPVSLLVVIVASMAGYAFAWGEFRGRDALFLVVVGLLVVPVQMGLIPAFNVFNFLGLQGIPSAVFFHVAFGLPFAIFLLRNFFAGLPSSLMEAARIDGATEWGIFFKVVLPLGLPAIGSLTIFQFMWVWNDLLVALVFTPGNPPITVALQQQLRQFGSNVDIIAPGAFVSMIVPLGVFFAFQRYFEAGLLGGVEK